MPHMTSMMKNLELATRNLETARHAMRDACIEADLAHHQRAQWACQLLGDAITPIQRASLQIIKDYKFMQRHGECEEGCDNLVQLKLTASGD